MYLDPGQFKHSSSTRRVYANKNGFISDIQICLHAPNVRKRAEGNVDTFVTTPQWLQLWQVRLLRGAAVSQNAAYMGKEHHDRHDQRRLYDGAIRACRHTRAWQQALFQIRKAGRDLVRPDAGSLACFPRHV